MKMHDPLISSTHYRCWKYLHSCA